METTLASCPDVDRSFLASLAQGMGSNSNAASKVAQKATRSGSGRCRSCNRAQFSKRQLATRPNHRCTPRS